MPAWRRAGGAERYSMSCWSFFPPGERSARTGRSNGGASDQGDAVTLGRRMPLQLGRLAGARAHLPTRARSSYALATSDGRRSLLTITSHQHSAIASMAGRAAWSAPLRAALRVPEAATARRELPRAALV